MASGERKSMNDLSRWRIVYKVGEVGHVVFTRGADATVVRLNFEHLNPTARVVSVSPDVRDP